MKYIRILTPKQYFVNIRMHKNMTNIIIRLLNAVNKAVKLGHGRRAVADERADAVFQKRCAVLFGEVADFLGCPALGYHAAKVAVDFDNFVNCGTSLVAGVAAAGTADRLINVSD